MESFYVAVIVIGILLIVSGQNTMLRSSLPSVSLEPKVPSVPSEPSAKDTVYKYADQANLNYIPQPDIDTHKSNILQIASNELDPVPFETMDEEYMLELSMVS